jgi:UDP-3-O-acyl-N-acetylglucosamine deacetylase
MKTKTYNTVGTIQESIIITQILRVRVMMINATFNNIPVISWQSVLMVEETRIPREYNRHKMLI